MFSTDFIFRQQENLVDNQKCQAGFRPLCNKILFLPLPWLSQLSCLKLAETANRAEAGKLQFWSEPSEILNLRSSNTAETVDLTPP